MAEIKEKLVLSARPGKLTLIRTGMFLKCYQQSLFSHLSPLGWEHINLTGDYIWRNNKKLAEGKYRPLRPVDISQYKK